MLEPAAIPVDGVVGRLMDFLFGPSATASRDEVLLMYEMLATFGLMVLFLFDVIGAIIESSVGKILLMFNSMVRTSSQGGKVPPPVLSVYRLTSLTLRL
eukprot:3530473-Pyramimonas_sp.AAC.2